MSGHSYLKKEVAESFPYWGYSEMDNNEKMEYSTIWSLGSSPECLLMVLMTTYYPFLKCVLHHLFITGNGLKTKSTQATHYNAPSSGMKAFHIQIMLGLTSHGLRQWTLLRLLAFLQIFCTWTKWKS